MKFDTIPRSVLGREKIVSTHKVTCRGVITKIIDGRRKVVSAEDTPVDAIITTKDNGDRRVTCVRRSAIFCDSSGHGETLAQCIYQHIN